MDQLAASGTVDGEWYFASLLFQQIRARGGGGVFSFSVENKKRYFQLIQESVTITEHRSVPTVE